MHVDFQFCQTRKGICQETFSEMDVVLNAQNSHDLQLHRSETFGLAIKFGEKREDGLGKMKESYSERERGFKIIRIFQVLLYELFHFV